MNNTFTNILLVVILVLLVGAGVWYVTKDSKEAPREGIEINLGAEEGKSSQ